MLLGTCSCAVVRCMLCALSGFAAPGGRCCLAPVCVPWLWPAAFLSGVPRGPAWCAAPRPVRLLSVLWSAFFDAVVPFPGPGACATALLGGCAGHAEAGREPGSLCLPLAPAEAGALGTLRVVLVRGPAMGLSLAGPSGVGLELPALRWLACVDPVTDASGFPYRPSFDEGLSQCTGAVSCGRQHLPLRVGGYHSRVSCVRACACSFWPGRAGRPPGRVLGRLTFSFGRFVFLLCLAPSGLGLRPSSSFAFVLFVVLFCFSFVFFPFSSLAPPLSLAFFGFWPRVPWALALCVVCFVRLALTGSPCALAFFVLPGRWPLSGGCPPPSLSRCCCRSSLRCACLFYFFSSSLRPPWLWLSVSSGPGCPGPWRLFVFVVLGSLCPVFFFSFIFSFPPSRFFVRSRLFCVSGLAAGFSTVVAAPPPLSLSVSRGFCRSCLVPWFFFLSFHAPLLSPAFSGFRPGCPGPWRCVLFVFLSLLLPGSLCALASFVSPAWPLAALWWLLPPPPLPSSVSWFFSLLLGALVFFFLLLPLCAPVVSGFLYFPASGALGLGAVRCLLGFPSASRPFVRFPLSRAFRLAVGCSLVVAAPPPLCVSRFSSRLLVAVRCVLCCAVCPWVRCCAALLRVVSPDVVLSCAVLLCCARLMPLLVAPCPLALLVPLGPCALRRCVLQWSPALCA